MKKKYETRYFVTDVASIPVVRVYGKTEMYRQAAKDGWGVVYRDENNTLVCDEDSSADFYTKNGGYFGLSGNDEVNTKEMPKQPECAAIITSDACGFTFWAEDMSQIHFFVTYDANGLVDSYRIEYGDGPIYDGEVEVSFEDLFEQPEGDWQETYRVNLPGTVEYQFKQEADELAEESGETWMDSKQREQFRQVCGRIDRIKSAWDFFSTMQLLGYDFDEKIINAARKFKKCYNFAQYEQPKEVARREELMENYEKYTLAIEDTVETSTEAEQDASSTAQEPVEESGAQDAEESENAGPTQYAIFEGNMERLEKKLTAIQNKCRKYGCDFRFEEVGEEFREMKDENGVKRMVRFVLVEAEGVAIVNGWRFIAKVEHTSKGNLINRACDIEVPARYYTSLPVCEHCNSTRARKDTYIVMNEETGEFKQVGKSCLRDFTHGMSAELVAHYIAAFDELIKGEEPCEGCHIESYIEVEEWLRYVAETIRHFGYVKRNNDGETCTRARAADYYDYQHGGTFGDKEAKRIREELEACGFNAESDEAKAETTAALVWLEEQEESNNYMHNLKTVCAMDYLGWKHLGIAASLFPSYNRELLRKEARERQEKADAGSEWCGEVGKRIEVDVAEMTCLTGWETQWGYTKIYKIVDASGNVFTWKTSNWVEDGVKHIKGTVKAHNEYRGTKQTELTRCKCAA